MSEQSYSGPSRMVKIDGAKVKMLRESQGLTQLYIATVVGVTTDTISRWENRRYPSIKEENGLKLAEALEVSIEQILETSDETAAPEEEPAPAVAAPKKPRPSRVFLWIPLLVIILLLPFIWYQVKLPPPVTILAERILPFQTPAGQPFPVVIHLTTKQAGPFSLILREHLPPECKPLVSAPPYTGFDSKNSSIKWIIRSTDQATTIVYLAQCSVGGRESTAGPSLRFSGAVTLSDKKSPETAIAGSLVLPVADYHWADANRDNRIDDAEILYAYDTFSALDSIDYNWDELDAIWSGEGYYWDAASRQYIIRK